YAWGWSKEHSPFYKGIFEMEGGVLKSGEQQVLTLSNSATYFFSTLLISDQKTLELLSKSQLATGRIGYTGILHFLSDQPNEYLKKIGVVIGGEIYGNQAVSSGNIALSDGYTIIFNPPRGSMPASSQFSSLSGASLLQQEIKHTEGFFNLVLGLNYSIEFLKKHKLNFAYKIYDSLAELKGGFLNKSTVYTSLGSGILPFSKEIKGDQRTEFNGNSIHLNYRYSVTDSFGIRLGFSQFTGTHKIKEGKIKEPANAFVIFGALAAGGDFLTPYIAGSRPAFGPYPSATDKRTQISIEFVYMF
ncbi:MAG: hypothetical protein N3A69_14700, partial [Leptospiraceae bacterium]|nr:hypothetical protein [Leptospiraceae bacterium]